MKNKNVNVNSYDRTHDITPEEVRRFERFKNYTDEQVNELIDTIKKYTRFIYNVVSKRKKFGKKIALHIDNQQTKSA
ncbi:hypothetical protein CJD36_022655 [Flavipsychrobacter stenotrophus]|uniref:Uncharacterized protein n=1 Tax=Flavipsychrobacter stenotrophus TaxID=2077091 RepID=A0A2S7SQ16_9BACT|nr:hypothetical protein [Flavipsychrobacter stenotrophus]PQJ08731.1 hypothetical protein CJD36_022655 [Flavipsychrobacter stenotrophus]